MKLFILKGSDQADQINLIKSRQSHQVAQIKLYQIKLNKLMEIKVLKLRYTKQVGENKWIILIEID